MTHLTQTKRNTASISLPRRNRQPRNKKTASRPVRRSRRSANEAALPPMASPSPKRKSLSPAITTLEGGAKTWERLVFFITLVLIILSASTFVYLRVQTRATRFEMTEMKHEELQLMKDREKLLERIGAYKQPDLIIKRAKQRGMQPPSHTQVVRLP